MINTSRLKAFFNNRHVRYGLPFISMVVGGSFIIREFKTVRYEFRKVESISRDQLFDGLGDKLVDPKELTIEEQYKKLQAEKAYEAWENKRIPRPYEEN